MLIQDLQFIEATNAIDNVHGGVAAYTGVVVSANGSKASADAFAVGVGDTTGASTGAYTKSAKGAYYELSVAVGYGVSYGLTVNGRDVQVASSVSSGVAKDIKRT